MASFLQRIGKKPMEKHLQVEWMDQELRNTLWNVLDQYVWRHWEDPPSSMYQPARSERALKVENLVRAVWVRHFKKPIDSLPSEFDTRGGVRSIFRSVILEGPWDEAYDLIDFIVGNVGSAASPGLEETMNQVLLSENAAYRFISSQLVPISAPEEVAAVETALETASKSVRTHLDAALAMLSDRQNPNYRNSVKESISAVEAACQVIAGKPKATLGQALAAIQSSKRLHGAFANALKSLYGYTSDADGIRHAMSDEAQEVTKADAQFMLVSCSAFVNYLWSVAAETGLQMSN